MVNDKGVRFCVHSTNIEGLILKGWEFVQVPTEKGEGLKPQTVDRKLLFQADLPSPDMEGNKFSPARKLALDECLRVAQEVAKATII